MRALLALALCAPSTVLACPPVVDHTAELADLFNAARSARTEMDGRRYGDMMWALWTQAPDDRAQEMLNRGMAKRRVADYEAAQAAFDELVDYCPEYAEGYNQRAFVLYLRHDYEAALADLERALARMPAHTGALSGKALSLIGLGRHAAAREALREALKLNPWLPERHLLVEPPGDDL